MSGIRRSPPLGGGMLKAVRKLHPECLRWRKSNPQLGAGFLRRPGRWRQDSLHRRPSRHLERVCALRRSHADDRSLGRPADDRRAGHHAHPRVERLGGGARPRRSVGGPSRRVAQADHRPVAGAPPRIASGASSSSRRRKRPPLGQASGHFSGRPAASPLNHPRVHSGGSRPVPRQDGLKDAPPPGGHMPEPATRRFAPPWRKPRRWSAIGRFLSRTATSRAQLTPPHRAEI